ncbi:uncharacterized protein [Oscarella lobularis]|uniref:uncharacterized protein isoform X2 n=1 Tax=Oscarella lobularis TaxID=121494 RepID=UPI0033138E14
MEFGVAFRLGVLLLSNTCLASRVARAVIDPLFDEIVLPEISSFSSLDYTTFLYDLSAIGVLAAGKRDELLEKLKLKEDVAFELFGTVLPQYGLGSFDKLMSVLLSTEGFEELAKSLIEKRSSRTAELAMKTAEMNTNLEKALTGPANLAKRIRFLSDPTFQNTALTDLRYLQVFSENSGLARECGIDPEIAKLIWKSECLREKLEDPMSANLFYENPDTGDMLVKYPNLVPIFCREPMLAVNLARVPEKLKTISESEGDEDERIATAKRFLTAKLTVKNAQEAEFAKELAEMWISEHENIADVNQLGFGIDPRIGEVSVLVVVHSSFYLQELGLLYCPILVFAWRRFGLNKTALLTSRMLWNSHKEELSLVTLIKSTRLQLFSLGQKLDSFVGNENVNPAYVKAFEQGSQAVRVLSKQPQIVEEFLRMEGVADVIRKTANAAKRRSMLLGTLISEALNKLLKILENNPVMNRRMFTEVSALRTFEAAKKQGLVTVVRARVHLVGKDNAGKTAVKNALLSQRFIENQESTVGIATSMAVFQAATKGKDGAWILQEEGKPSHVIAAALKKVKQDASDSESGFSNHFNSFKPGEYASQENHEKVSYPFDEESVKEAEHKNFELPFDSESFDSSYLASKRRTRTILPFDRSKTLDEERIVQSFSESQELHGTWKKMATLPSTEPVYSSITLWDEGGQEQYLNMQTPFIAEDAVHLLMFDLTQHPDSKVKFTTFRYRDGTKVEQPSFGYHTYGAVLHVWLSMLAISGGGLANKLANFFGENLNVTSFGEAFVPQVASPPCILVGTRSSSPEALTQEYQKFLKNLFSTHEKALLLDHIVENEESNESAKGLRDPLLFYPVECNYASKEEIEAANRQKSSTSDNIVIPQDPNFGKIRQIIMNAAQQFWQKRQLPKRWLILQLLNDHISKESAIVHESSLFSMAQKACKIPSKEEFGYAMTYLDALGMIIYRPRSNYRVLKDHIITDPSWIFDLFSRFLPMISQETGRTPRNDEEAFYPAYRSDLAQVQEKGVMNSRLVKYFLDHVKRARSHRGEMLRLLQDFDVLAPCSESEATEEDSFYVPCLVQKRLKDLQQCFIFQTDGRQMYTSPLVLKADSILIWPEPLFFRLVTRFINKFQPRKVLVERNRVVINDIDSSSHMMALEFLYLDPKYVTATVRYRPLEDGLHFVQKKSRELRQMIVRELNDVKKLGFENFRFHTCFCRRPRTLPDPSSDGSDLYTNLEQNLIYKAISDVYYRAEDDYELLPVEIASELLFWYSDDESTSPKKDSGKFSEPFPSVDDEVTERVKTAVADVIPERYYNMLGEILGLDSEDLEKISLQRLRSIIAIINVWQAKMNSHGEKPTVGRLLEAGRKLNIEEKTIREAFYKPRVFFPPDTTLVTKESRKIISALVEAGRFKWMEIGVKTGFHFNELEEIDKSVKGGSKMKMLKIADDWMTKISKTTVGEIVHILDKVGVHRSFLEKAYLDMTFE